MEIKFIFIIDYKLQINFIFFHHIEFFFIHQGVKMIILYKGMICNLYMKY